MDYEEFKQLIENAPEGSELANLREAMEKTVHATINEQIKELMTEYSLTYGEAMLIVQKRWETHGREELKKQLGIKE